MKKVLTLLAFATVITVPAAKARAPLFDDSASFQTAKSVKLGYGESSGSVFHGLGSKTVKFATCSTDDQCLSRQVCVNGRCKELCSPSPCSGRTPDCDAEDHAYTCKCTENSCGEGSACVNGKCETCTVGSKCACDGEKVLGANGTCVCPGTTVSDGYGGCKAACEFSTAAACKAGTANCTDCALSGGCYACSACSTGYEPINGKCVAKTCSDSGYYNGTSCPSFLQYQTSLSNGCHDRYGEMGMDCNARGQIGIGECDVDSWRRCCEACVGRLQ